MTSWRDIRDRRLQDPAARTAYDAAREELDAELRLHELREHRGLSQEEVAKLLEVSQPSVSKTERQGDVRLSTLYRYIRALGGELEISARFPDETVPISLTNPTT